MLTIGAFERNIDEAIEGTLCGLGIGTIPVLFVKNAGAKDNQPDHYLIADPHSNNFYPIGKAWEPRDGKEHYYVKIESPFMHTPVIKASLFPDKTNKGQFNLIWYSPDDNQPKADARVGADTSDPQEDKQPQRQRSITNMISKKFSPKM